MVHSPCNPFLHDEVCKKSSPDFHDAVLPKADLFWLRLAELCPLSKVGSIKVALGTIGIRVPIHKILQTGQLWLSRDQFFYLTWNDSCSTPSFFIIIWIMVQYN